MSIFTKMNTPNNNIFGNSPSLILLDRDGVINRNSVDYIKTPEEWEPIKGSLEAISEGQQRGIEFAVCTNQSGLGRDLFSKDDLFNMHAKCNSILRSLGGRPLSFFFCPHKPENNCVCRKPRPLLIDLAIDTLSSKRTDTIFVGDSFSDLEAARSASVQFILVQTGNGESTYRKISGLDEKAPPYYSDLQRFLRSF